MGFALAAIMPPDRQQSLVNIGSATGQVVSEVTLGEEVTHHVGDIARVTQLYRPTLARPADPNSAVHHAEGDGVHRELFVC